MHTNGREYPPELTQGTEKLIIRRLHRLRRFRFQVDPCQGVKGAGATTAVYKPEKLSPALSRNLRNLRNLRIINFSFLWAGPRGVRVDSRFVSNLRIGFSPR